MNIVEKKSFGGGVFLEAIAIVGFYNYLKGNTSNPKDNFASFIKDHPPVNGISKFNDTLNINGTPILTTIYLDWGTGLKKLIDIFGSDFLNFSKEEILNIISQDKTLLSDIELISSAIKETTLARKVKKLAEEWDEYQDNVGDSNFKLYIFSAGKVSKGDTKVDVAIKFDKETYDLNKENDFKLLFSKLNPEDNTSYGASVKGNASYIGNSPLKSNEASEKIIQLIKNVPGGVDLFKSLGKISDNEKDNLLKTYGKITNTPREEKIKSAKNQIPLTMKLLDGVYDYFNNENDLSKQRELLDYFSSISFGVGDEVLSIKGKKFKLGDREMIKWFKDNSIKIKVKKKAMASKGDKLTRFQNTYTLQFFLTDGKNNFELFDITPEIHMANDFYLTLNGRQSSSAKVNNWMDLYKNLKSTLDMDNSLKVQSTK
jgi:hypothetical protein